MAKLSVGVGVTTAIVIVAGLSALLSEHLNAIAQPANDMPITARLNTVFAAFDAERGDFCLEEPQLQIVRQGETLIDGPLPEQIMDELGFCHPSALTVTQLDRNDEPEVVLDVYSGGAHCCFSSLIYSYQDNLATYATLEHFWGNGGYQLTDVDEDGVPEFTSRDDNFAYAFASYAASRYPIAIWRYQAGQMHNVTREFPALIYGDAYHHWEEYTQLRNGELFDLPYSHAADYPYQDYEKAILAAYLADKYLLDQQNDGWARVQAAYQRSDREAFFAQLQTFLEETGYTRPD